MSTKNYSINKTRGGGFTLRIYGEFSENTVGKDFYLTWGINPKQVKNIVFHGESGMKTLEDGAFVDFDNLQSIDFQVQLEVIGSCIFSPHAWGTLKQVKMDVSKLQKVAPNPFFELTDMIPKEVCQKFWDGEDQLYSDLPTIIFSHVPEESEILCGLRAYNWMWKDTCMKLNPHVGSLCQFLVKHKPYCYEFYKNPEGKKCSEFSKNAELWGYSIDYKHVNWNERDAQVVCLEKEYPFYPSLNISIQFGGHESQGFETIYERKMEWLAPSSTIEGLLREDDETYFSMGGCFGQFCEGGRYEFKYIGVNNQYLELNVPSKKYGGLLHAIVFGNIDPSNEITIEVEPVHPIDQYWAYRLTSKFGCKVRSWRDRPIGCADMCPEEYERFRERKIMGW